MTWKGEVRTTGDPPDSYSSNALRFESKEEAERYTADLAERWLAVVDWRVAECSDPVTARIERRDDGLLYLVHLT